MKYYLHLLCRRDRTSLKGLTFDKASGRYVSQAWDFPKEQADKLLGGSIFLHEEKGKSSTIGGVVTGVVEVSLDETDPAARKDRIAFEFEPKLDMKGVKWRGDNHSMAWNSGIKLDG